MSSSAYPSSTCSCVSEILLLTVFTRMVMAYETIKSENHIFMQQDVFVVILAAQRWKDVFLIVSTLMKALS